MENPTASVSQLAGASKRVLSRLLTIGENRLELLMVEVQEERDRILRTILLALGAAVFGLLAGIALTVAIVVFFWERSPVTAMLILAALYSAVSAWLYASYLKLQREWETFSGTVEQLRKDRKCLEQFLA